MLKKKSVLQSGLQSPRVQLQDQISFFKQSLHISGQDHRLPYEPNCDLTTQVRQSIASSLEHLSVTRIDSYILHGPSRSDGLGQADWETWRAMEGAVDEGFVALLGISNV